MKDAFIKLHISVILAGLTGLFGKLVSLHQVPMVWYRVSLAAIILWLILWIRKELHIISFKNLLRVGGVGTLLALHWVFFFGSIKASNISVGVVCYSLVGFFTSILEPIILRAKFSVRDTLLSMIAVVGIALIFHFDADYRYGIILGCVSSLLASLFTIYNKLVVDKLGLKPSTMLVYELIGGSIVLTLFLGAFISEHGILSAMPTVADFMWLLMLSSLCTIGLQLLQIESLKVLSAFTVNLTYNLEPIYSIIIAMTVFHEAQELSATFYLGLALIILSVALKTIRIMTHKKETA